MDESDRRNVGRAETCSGRKKNSGRTPRNAARRLRVSGSGTELPSSQRDTVLGFKLKARASADILGIRRAALASVRRPGTKHGALIGMTAAAYSASPSAASLEVGCSGGLKTLGTSFSTTPDELSGDGGGVEGRSRPLQDGANAAMKLSTVSYTRKP